MDGCEYHSGILAAIDSINNKLTMMEKSLDKQLEYIEKAREVAKQEMDRRLDGMNHLSAQLNEQRVENRTRIAELNAGFVSRSEMGLILDKVGIRINILEDMLHERRGATTWANHIITAMIALAIFIMSHYLFKF